MAYGYSPANSMSAPAGAMQNGIPQQNVIPQAQPLFPQPHGNVYQINSTLEVANVPVGAGMSIALCLPENVMYIKTMQNGNPLFYPYKIEPLTGNTETTTQSNAAPAQGDFNELIERLTNQLKSYDERITALEQTRTKQKGGFDL